MANWFMRWVVSAIALAIVAHLGIGVSVANLTSLIAATIVIGLINSLIRPILVLLTLPLNCLTFGLFGFVLNAILFMSTQLFVPGFKVTSLVGALVGPILMGLISGLLNHFLPDPGQSR